MGIGIFDARIMLRVKTVQQLRKKQKAHRESLKDFGVDVPETVIATPVHARIEANRWLFDCVCGSGVAVNPSWSEARCMGDDCGRVYTKVVIPADRAAIESTLLEMPPALRYWYPGERAADVAKVAEPEIWDRHATFLTSRKAKKGGAR